MKHQSNHSQQRARQWTNSLPSRLRLTKNASDQRKANPVIMSSDTLDKAF
jgi:hypothetical protein